MAGKKNTAPSGLEGILSQQNWEGRTEPKGLGRVDRAQMMGGGDTENMGEHTECRSRGTQSPHE